MADASSERNLFNPYPGLRSFHREEDYLFFGREEQTAELVRRLGRNRFLAVVGTSGSGKSSLVRCGLLSELQGGGMAGAGSHWEIAVMHPGGDPLHSLADCLLAAELYDRDDPESHDRLMATLRRSDAGLVEAVRQADLAQGSNLLLVVDQFEEIFRFHQASPAGAEEAPDFVRLLLEAARNAVQPVYVVLTMRSDFLGDCSRFAGLAEAVNEGEYLIPRLSREQTRSAIEGPARVAGGEIQWRLLVRLLNDLEEQADRLPVLQHCLMRLWNVWERDHLPGEQLDLRHYEATGGLAEALSLHADEVYEALTSDATRHASEKVFKALTEKGADNRGIRRPARLGQLVAIAGGDAVRDDVVAVIEAFRMPGVTFLLPSEETSLQPDTVVDISHESLMRVWKRLKAWVEEEAQSVRIYRRLSESAELWKEGRAGLYHDPDLQIARTWRETQRPTDEWGRQNGGGFAAAMEFLEASGKAAETERHEREAARNRELEQAKALAEAQRQRVAAQIVAGRKLKRLLALSASIAVLALIASVFAVFQRGRAKHSEQAAQGLAEQLKTQLVRGDLDQANTRLAEDDPATGLAHLARAMRTDPKNSAAGMRALSALSSGLLPNRRFPPLEHRRPISLVLQHPERDLILTSSEAGAEVALWDLQSGERVHTLAQGLAVIPANPLGQGALSQDPSPTWIGSDVFQQARWILYAEDSAATPERTTRHYRKRISYEGKRPIAKAEIFLRVDDAFELRVNGRDAGHGDTWNVFHYADVSETASGSESLLVEIAARNSLGVAGFIAAVRLTDADGKQHIVSSDASWQSAAEADGEFRESQVLGSLETWNIDAPNGKGGRMLRNPRWNLDSSKLIALFLPENRIRAWHLDSGGMAAGSIDASNIEGEFEVVRGDAGEDWIAFADKTGALQIWNLTEGVPATPPLRTRGLVTDWQLTPDRRRIAGLFTDGAIGIWNIPDGSFVREIVVQPVTPDKWLFNRDGTWLAALGNDYSVLNFWEVQPQARQEYPDWIHLAAAGRESPLTTAFAQEIQFLKGTETLLAVTVAAPAEDGVQRLFARTFECSSRNLRAAIDFPVESANVAWMGQLGSGASVGNPLAVDEAGMRLVAASQVTANINDSGFALSGVLEGNQVGVWDLRTGNRVARLVAPELLGTANLAPDGRTLIAGSFIPPTSPAAGTDEKRLYVFDLVTGQLALPNPIVLPGAAYLSFSPDGNTMVTHGGYSDAARFWNLNTGRQVRSAVPEKEFAACVFSSAGDRVALFALQSTSRGDRSLGQNLGLFSLHQMGLPPAMPDALTPAGMTSVVRASTGERRWITVDRPDTSTTLRVQTWDAAAQELLRTDSFQVREGTSNWTPAWSKDGSRLIYKSWNGGRTDSALVFDVPSGEVVETIRIEDYLSSVGVSADGSVVALGSTDGKVTTWTPQRGSVQFEPFAQADRIGILIFNDDGSLLLLGDEANRNMAIVDPSSGSPRFGPLQIANPVFDARFLPGKSEVIVSVQDHRLLTIDLEKGSVREDIVIDDWSRGMDLSPDGSLLAIGSGADQQATSGLAYLWDLKSDNLHAAPLQANGTPMSVRFSPDGSILATGTSQTATGFGYVQLWDVETGLPLTAPFPGRGLVTFIAFQADGSAVAAAWSDGVIRTIPLPQRGTVPEWLPDLAEAVAGVRLHPDSGAIDFVPGTAVDPFYDRFSTGSGSGEDDENWSRWIRWMFQEPSTRPLSPGAATTVAEYVQRLRRSANPEDLREALRMSPNDGLTAAWLALRSSDGLPEPGTPGGEHWTDTALRLSDHALKWSPENPEVWTLRSELLRRRARFGDAVEAALQAVERQDPDQRPADPGPSYALALALEASGESEGADKAFSGALAAMASWSTTSTGQEQPLLGVLELLKPENSDAPRRDIRLPEPISTTYQDFDSVAEGTLPEGWSVSNNSDDSTNALSRSLNDRNSNAFKDWVVLSVDRFTASGNDVDPRLWNPATHSFNGRPVRLLTGNFIVAESDSRSGRQIQHLFTPDFDCSGISGVHVAFHSVYTQNQDAIAALEVSTDQGVTWQPVLYRLEENDVIRNPNGGVDAVTTFSKLQGDTPRFRGADGRVRGDRFGDFIAAEITSGLGPFIESAKDEERRHGNRIEVFRVKFADGQPNVRFRFTYAGSSSWSWIVDAFGLYAMQEGSSPFVAEAQRGQSGEPSSASLDPERLFQTAESLLRQPLPGSGDLDLRLLARNVLPQFADQGRALHLHAQTLLASSLPDALPEALAAAEQAIALRGDIRGYWDTLARVNVRLGQRALDQDHNAEAALRFEAAGAILDRLGTSDLTLRQQVTSGMLTTGRTGLPRVLVPSGLSPQGRWKFLDDGSDQGAAWRTLDFDDSLWKVGLAPLGFGDDRVATRIAAGPSDAKHITAYFRSEFILDDALAFSQIELELQRDDGVVVYLNGVEIARSNMPPGEIRFDTRAVTTINEEAEEVVHRLVVPAETLRAGRNVIAAEVHQSTRTSTDLGFDLRVTALGLAAEKIPPAQELEALEAGLGVSIPVRAILWAARARLLQDAGLASRAEEARQRLLSLAEDDPVAWWFAARAAVRAGDSETAYSQYRRALTTAIVAAPRVASWQRVFLPPGLVDFGRLADNGPLTVARAGVLRAGSADADRGWELQFLNRWLEETAPEDSDVRKERAAFLLAAGEFAQAEALVDELLLGYPDETALNTGDVRKRKALLALRERILRGMGRREEADAVRQQIFAIPPRRPDAGPEQLDLTKFYNASLYDGRDWENNVDLHLSFLPETFVPHDGIAFDIRGIVQLSGTNMPAALPYPRQVAAIPVDAETIAIHFLLATSRAYDERPGVEVGRIVFRYADGGAETLRLVFQENIADWWAYSHQTIDPARIAWQGINTEPGSNEPFQLFHIAWRNPHPARRIAALDLESAMATSAPFVVAITLE